MVHDGGEVCDVDFIRNTSIRHLAFLTQMFSSFVRTHSFPGRLSRTESRRKSIVVGRSGWEEENKDFLPKWPRSENSHAIDEFGTRRSIGRSTKTCKLSPRTLGYYTTYLQLNMSSICAKNMHPFHGDCPLTGCSALSHLGRVHGVLSHQCGESQSWSAELWPGPRPCQQASALGATNHQNGQTSLPLQRPSCARPQSPAVIRIVLL